MGKLEKRASQDVGKQNQANAFVHSHFNTFVGFVVQKLLSHFWSGKRLCQVLAKFSFQEKQRL